MYKSAGNFPASWVTRPAVAVENCVLVLLNRLQIFIVFCCRYALASLHLASAFTLCIYSGAGTLNCGWHGAVLLQVNKPPVPAL